MTDRDTTGGGELGDLPGLEGQSTQDLVGGWSNKDWAEWFRDEVMSTRWWEPLGRTIHDDPTGAPITPADSFLLEQEAAADRVRELTGAKPKEITFPDPIEEFARDIGTGEIDEGLASGALALWRDVTLWQGRTGPGGAQPVDWHFSRISPEFRLQFFEGWYRVMEGAPSQWPARDYLQDLQPDAPTSEGPAQEEAPQARPPRLSPMVLAIGSALALALVLILVFTLLGGDETPTATEEAPAEQAAEPEGIEFQTSFGPATYFGPTSFAAGEPIEVTIEYRDANGDPIAGATLYFSLISSDDEAHFETVTDENGRAVFTGSGPATPGTYQVLASDGGEPWEITVAEVT